MAVKKQLPTKYKATEQAIFKLVSNRGISKSVCISKFGLSPNHFNIYKGTAENFDSAMSHFIADVLMKSVTDNLNFDSASRRYLMSKMRTCDSEIELPVKHMRSADDASRNLSYGLYAYSQKLISEETLVQIRSACSVFSDLMVATTLQSEVKALQELFEERFNNA